jgi:hypothetical protein
MRRATGLLCACAALLGTAAPAQASFGLNDFDVSFAGSDAALAGAHPDSATFSFGVNYSEVEGEPLPDGELKDATFTQMPGLVFNPTAAPRCDTAVFLAAVSGISCPSGSRVGTTAIEINGPGFTETATVYNLEPPPGSAARFGFNVLNIPIVIDGGVGPQAPNNLFASLRNTRQTARVFGASLTLDGQIGAKPFITLPTSCAGPQRSSYEVFSWEGESDSGSVLTHDEHGAPQGFLGCGNLPFAPQISSQATSEDASSPSGLDFELSFDQQGLLSPDGRAQSTLKEAEVALPAGMTVNPSIAEGLGACSEADLARETLAAAPGEGCPNSSKIGSVEVDTPLLEETIPGSVYIATPESPDTAAHENPFASLIAFYIVLKDPRLGVLIKQPAEVTPDPRTGQLVTRVTEIPQLPFSDFHFHFREGQRAPLITPPRCGAFATTARLTPSADPGSPLAVSASFQVTRGVGGGPCPAGGTPPFDPGFEASSLNNAAHTYSPFLMRLTRADGRQDITRFAATLPAGVTGKLAGVGRCPEVQIALARAKSGRAEHASPSCPAASRIGSTLAGAGVGGTLLYVPGSLYLAGPTGGAPLSVVAVTPALAGPFDAGTVVVRVALDVNPVSGRVSVDPTASDRIPHILQGIPLNVRDLRVSADRPSFTLNPTSCEEESAEATLWGSYLDVFDPLGSTSPEAAVGRSARYQAAGCGSLGFRPRLSLSLKGGVHRGAHPALRAVYRPRPQDANLRRLALLFPRSEFVENANFRTICTRVQFAAGAGQGAGCPEDSVYGRVTAFSPLLDEPLEGPVYLRSSNHNLPDAVFALHGIVDIEVATRIDSLHGRLRATVLNAPDLPVSRVVVQMQGARKGLFVNSRNTCGGANRAHAALLGQNAKPATLRPPLANPRCKRG